jgi:hypothetical protein
MRLEAKLDSFASNASVCPNAANVRPSSSPESSTLHHDLKLSSPSEVIREQSELEKCKSSLEKKLDRIARDKRSRVRKIESEQAMWLEYIFGICKADRHFGKRGSR